MAQVALCSYDGGRRSDCRPGSSHHQSSDFVPLDILGKRSRRGFKEEAVRREGVSFDLSPGQIGVQRLCRDPGRGSKALRGAILVAVQGVATPPPSACKPLILRWVNLRVCVAPSCTKRLREYLMPSKVSTGSGLFFSCPILQRHFHVLDCLLNIRGGP